MSKYNLRYFDSEFGVIEQLPREFSVSFKEVEINGRLNVQVLFNDTSQAGDIINDNSYFDDYYRYHDIFHYTFATLLGWSPCTRALIKRKRKSVPLIDEVEDGARATITEEAISLIIFNEAKRKKFFEGEQRVSKTILRIIKDMTDNFEVKIRTSKEWELAILKSYEIFRLLKNKKGGKVFFNMSKRVVNYLPLAA